jgi:hypothetical protein
MAYLGNTPTTQSFISGTDYFSGNGSTTAFTLTRTVASVNDIEAVVNNVVQRPNDAYTISGTTITFTSAPSSGTDNIYVRYLSTTTQSITPSQNTVSYSTLNTDLQSGGYASNFKNRIINGAMVIDQRNAGASVTPTNGQFSVDRWKYGSPAGSGVVSLQRVADAPAGFINSLKCTVTTASTPSSGDTYTILQPIEGSNIYDFNLGTASAQAFTISFWVKSSVTGTFSVAVRSTGGAQTFLKNYVVSSANTWEYKTVLISAPTSGTFATDTSSALFVNFSLGAGSSFISTESSWNSGAFSQTSGATNLIANSGATFYITGVQLEKGSTATSFDYRPYGTELALCQRYYQLIAKGSFKGIALGTYATSTFVEFNLPLIVTMRAVPTLSQVTGTNYYEIYTAGVGDGFNSLALNTSQTTERCIIAENATEVSGTGGRAGLIYTTNASAFLAVQAEL